MAVLFLTFILSVPVQLYAGGSEEGADEEQAGSQTVPTMDDGMSDNILTEQEVMEMGIPTRSAPWNQWERYGFPGSGESPVLAYNSTSKKIYTYGGGSINTGGFGTSYSSSSDQFFYDLDTKDWTSFEKGTSPGDRFQASYAVDEGRGKVYVYGGNQGGAVLNDLWELDLGTETWKRLDASLLASGRAMAPMVLDPNDGDKGTLYIHMGLDTTLNNASGFYKVDLANVGATPVVLNDGTGSGILTMSDHDMCIDTVNDNIYLWGGRHKYNDSGMGGTWDYFANLWVYSIGGNSWTKLNNPVEFGTKIFYGAKLFFRSSDSTVNLWGGREARTGSAINRTLWSYHTDTQTWTWKHYASGDSPSARMFYGRYYSALSDRFLIFQGRYYSGQYSYRYSDVAYLDMATKVWTRIPGNRSASSVSAGIFAYNNDPVRPRLFYIGPGITSTQFGGNGTAYIYYFDLITMDWRGPFYNPSGVNPSREPSGRSNMGICYVPTTNEVFLYGGGGMTQGGMGQPDTYYDFADMWKINMNTYSWTKLYDAAGPGERQGFQMKYNSRDGYIYFYGGYNHPDTSEAIVILEDFYKLNPLNAMFTQIPLTGKPPGARYGSSLLYEPDDNLLYLFGGNYLKPGGTNPQEQNDLYSFNFTTQSWSLIDAAMKPSSRSYGQLVYDPLTKELILTGGSNNNDLIRYRILEARWYMDSTITVTPGNLNNHAVCFLEGPRDLYLFGGGARSGVWKFGVPQRLGIQKMVMVDPQGANGLAYAMLRPYHFQASIKAVNDVSEIAEARFIFQHKDGVFSVVYNHTLDDWSEVDVLDRAYLTGQSSSNKGLYLTVDFWVKFNWTWVMKTNVIDRTVTVRVKGTIAPDELVVKSFLTVKNTLELRGILQVDSEFQGPIQNGSWVRAGENVNFHGLVVAYTGVNVYPPLDSYTLVMWDSEDNPYYSTHQPGDEINITIESPDTTSKDNIYKINITGVPPETDTSKMDFRFSTDSEPPAAPGQVMVFDNAGSEKTTSFDNDPVVFISWQPSDDMGASGVKRYFWSLSDKGGTTQGTPIEFTTSPTEINLTAKGDYTIYVWAEDYVGHIGPATGARIIIDMEPISFRVVNPPDLNQEMPYKEVDFTINLTDAGGSGITTLSVKYRFTNNGVQDNQWLGSTAWKWIDSKYQEVQQTQTMEIVIPLGSLTNGYDNHVQLQAADGAGTIFYSPIYILMVNEDLKYPKAQIIGPANGTKFSNPDDVVLEWNVTFYNPADVTYKIFMSTNKNEVTGRKTSALWTTVYEGLTLNPSGLDYGTYYWTVEPWALEKFQGSCTNGVWWFQVLNEANYAFEFKTTAEPRIKQEQGSSTVIPFNIKNTGQKVLNLTPSLSLVGGGNVTDLFTYKWPSLNRFQQYSLQLQQELDIVFEIMHVSDSAPIGNYTLNFTFTNQYGIKESVLIQMEIVEKSVAPPPEPEPTNLGPLIALGIAAVILIMLIIGALYFFLVKKKTKDTHRDIEAELDQMEGDYVTGASSLRVAPQPKGLKSGPLPSSKAGAPKAPVEEEADEDGIEWEAPKLAEEDSEDSWMNLVASETIDEVSKSETVEEDKLVQTDKEKSLKDLLLEMSDEEEK